MALDALERIFTAGASDWSIAQTVASQLPGKIDGPADAYRHLMISAELHRRFDSTYADSLLTAHERLCCTNRLIAEVPLYPDRLIPLSL